MAVSSLSIQHVGDDGGTIAPVEEAVNALSWLYEVGGSSGFLTISNVDNSASTAQETTSTCQKEPVTVEMLIRMAEGNAATHKPFRQQTDNDEHPGGLWFFAV